MMERQDAVRCWPMWRDKLHSRAGRLEKTRIWPIGETSACCPDAVLHVLSSSLDSMEMLSLNSCVSSCCPALVVAEMLQVVKCKCIQLCAFSVPALEMKGLSLHVLPSCCDGMGAVAEWHGSCWLGLAKLLDSSFGEKRNDVLQLHKSSTF
jgi:hypothetical protein